MPTFELNLGCEIHPFTATGNFDGAHPVLTAITSAGKAILFSPQQFNDKGDCEKRFVSFHSEVTSYTVGRLPGTSTDVMFIGTSSGISVFDPEENTYIFTKELPNGVSSLLPTAPSSFPDTAVVVGGSCSVQGFDANGDETFWTVASDDVTCVESINYDGNQEIIAGCADGYIRVYNNIDVVYEYNESAKIISLLPLTTSSSPRFAYALSNGIVGVYEGRTRQWRIKGKFPCLAMRAVDYDGDGEDDLVIGWEHGKVEVRKVVSGSLVTRENLGQNLAGLEYFDLISSSTKQLLLIGRSGLVKGITFTDQNDTSQKVINNAEYEGLLEEKRDLIKRITFLEKGILAAKKGKSVSKTNINNVQFKFSTSPGDGCLELHVEAQSNDVYIHVIVVTADVAFNGSQTALFERSEQPGKSMTVKFVPPINYDLCLSVDILISSMPVTYDYKVSNHSIDLPRFCHLFPINQLDYDEGHYVTFPDNNQFYQIFALLLDNSGNLDSPVQTHQTTNQSKLMLKSCISDEFNLVLSKSEKSINLFCQSIDLCGEVIQFIGSRLEWSELSTICSFPSENSLLEKHVNIISESNSHRLRMTSDSAEGVGSVKELVVKVEDARLSHDYDDCRLFYNELLALNHQLMGEYQVKMSNMEVLMSSLKYINGIIQKSSKLRIGKAKTQVIDSCRKAVKSGNTGLLSKIISGKA
ncbi:hypothetical protein P9112_012715 [Eukaryota sp. TZLM1-RC]